MRIRFQADADFNQIIVAAVLRRLPGADFRSATDAGLAGLDDRTVLGLAARDGRVPVTHDKFVAKATSPGVIVPQSLPVARVLEDLTLIWSASESGEWTNRLAYLPL